MPPDRSFTDKLVDLVEQTKVPGVGNGLGGRYSAGQIARTVGVTVTTVTNWLNGVTKGPKTAVRRKLAELFGVDKHYFDDDYDGDEARQRPPPDPQATALVRAALDDAGVREIFFRTVAEDDDGRAILLDLLRGRASRRRPDQDDES